MALLWIGVANRLNPLDYNVPQLGVDLKYIIYAFFLCLPHSLEFEENMSFVDVVEGPGDFFSQVKLNMADTNFS